MNPVRAVFREVAGAWRSLRYDLSRRDGRLSRGRGRRPADPDHAEVARRAPSAVAPPRPVSRTRQRLVLGAAGLVLLALAVGGVTAMVTGLHALFEPGTPPAALPAHAAPAPSPTTVTVTATSAQPSPAAAVARHSGAPSASPHAGPSRSARPPVPTPAPGPTCGCTAPPSPRTSTTPSASPSASPSPSPSPTGEPTPGPTNGPAAGPAGGSGLGGTP